jgi:hypothetical protein
MISGEEALNMFEEWKEVTDEWYDIAGTFRKRMESIPSRMRFPAKDWEGMKI